MHNEFNKNKRIFPIPCVVKKTTPIALPPANEKHLSFNGHVTGCPCKLCTTARLTIGANPAPTGGKGPGQDGWESVDGVVEGPVQAMNNEGPTPARWPDGGINNPVRVKKTQLSLVQIAEPKSVNSESLNADFQRTSIDNLAQLVEDAAEDDQNDWGGISNMLDQALQQGLANLNMSAEAEETKYGPGNYPDDDNDTSYRTPEFFHNIFTKKKSPYLWMVPNLLAIGPHPIFSSHLDDLSVLKEAGIKAIVSLFDKPLNPKHVKGFHYFFIPTLEGHSSDLNSICRFIDTQDKLGNPVFIHSFAGKGRCAAAVAAYLVHKGWLTAEESIEWVRQHLDESAIETVAQEDAVLKFSIDR